MKEVSRESIVNTLEEKMLLKQKVLDETKAAFVELRNIIKELFGELKNRNKDLSKAGLLEYKENGEYELQLTLADETLVFVMHSNVFTFEQNHEIFKNSYVTDDPSRSFCGKIFIYNFLADSFRYNRTNDIGFLIARIFINKEGHYFVEGKKQISYLYNDFAVSVLDRVNITSLLNAAIVFSLDFDPFTPPIEMVDQITVGNVIQAGLQGRIATSKRLGFEFTSESNNFQGSNTEGD